MMRVQILASSKRLTIRWILVLAIAAIELIAITSRYELPPLFTPPFLPNNVSWSARLFYFSKHIWPLGLWIIGASLIILSPRFKSILSDLREQSSGYRWLVWLVFNLLAFAVFAVVTALIFEILTTNPARLSAPWIAELACPGRHDTATMAARSCSRSFLVATDSPGAHGIAHGVCAGNMRLDAHRSAQSARSLPPRSK